MKTIRQEMEEIKNSPEGMYKTAFVEALGAVAEAGLNTGGMALFESYKRKKLAKKVDAMLSQGDNRADLIKTVEAASPEQKKQLEDYFKQNMGVELSAFTGSPTIEKTAATNGAAALLTVLTGVAGVAAGKAIGSVTSKNDSAADSLQAGLVKQKLINSIKAKQQTKNIAAMEAVRDGSKQQSIRL